MGTAIVYPKKRALRKLTKSEKKTTAKIREEISYLERVSAWPFNVPIQGERYRKLCLLGLRIKLWRICSGESRQR
jgi:hypothetical protein